MPTDAQVYQVCIYLCIRICAHKHFHMHIIHSNVANPVTLQVLQMKTMQIMEEMQIMHTM